MIFMTVAVIDITVIFYCLLFVVIIATLIKSVIRTVMNWTHSDSVVLPNTTNM